MNITDDFNRADSIDERHTGFGCSSDSEGWSGIVGSCWVQHYTDEQWKERVWRGFDSAHPDDLDAEPLGIPVEWPGRRPLLVVLLAAAVMLALLGEGAALGRVGHTRPDVRFVQVDPPSKVTVTP